MPSLWTASFARITGIQFLTFAAFQLVTPVLPVYLSRFTDNEALIGSAVGVFTVSAVTARLWMGPVIDRSGRSAPLTYGLLVLVAASALYALAGSTESVMAVRVLHGAAFGTVTTAVSAMAADVIPARRRAEGMGLFGTSVNLAQTVAPVLGFTLVGLGGFDLTFLSGAAVAVLALALGRFQPETHGLVPGAAPPAAARRIGFEPAALVPSLLVFAVSMAFGGVNALLPLYAAEHGVANPGVMFSVLALAVLSVRLFTGRLADRWGPVPLTAGGLVLAAAALFVVGAWPGTFTIAGLPGGILVGVMLYGFGHGSVTPVAQGVSIARVPRARWGAASATFFSFLDFGIGLGSAALGVVAEALGLAAMYRWAALLPLAGFAVLVATRDHWVLVGEPEPAADAPAAVTPQPARQAASGNDPVHGPEHRPTAGRGARRR
ncbi:MAG TPA: MFS transporter [Bacillota bacterium]